MACVRNTSVLMTSVVQPVLPVSGDSASVLQASISLRPTSVLQVSTVMSMSVSFT